MRFFWSPFSEVPLDWDPLIQKGLGYLYAFLSFSFHRDPRVALLPDRERRILCTLLVQGVPVVNVQSSLHPSCALLCLLHDKKPCKDCLIHIYCGVSEFAHSMW